VTGRKEVVELALGIGITRKEDQDEGRHWVHRKLFRLWSRTSSALGGMFFSIIG